MKEQIPVAVLDAVADVEGVEPRDLDPTLQDAVETEALRSLARHSGDSWTLSFPFAGHDVTVRGDGAILVDDRREGTWLRADGAEPADRTRPEQ